MAILQSWPNIKVLNLYNFLGIPMIRVDKFYIKYNKFVYQILIRIRLTVFDERFHVEIVVI